MKRSACILSFAVLAGALWVQAQPTVAAWVAGPQERVTVRAQDDALRALPGLTPLRRISRRDAERTDGSGGVDTPVPAVQPFAVIRRLPLALLQPAPVDALCFPALHEVRMAVHRCAVF